MTVSAGLGYIGVTSYNGSRLWAQYTVAGQAGNAIAALDLNYAAYVAFPLSPEYRRQLPGTMAYLLAKHQPSVQIDPAAADLAAKIARTAGPDDTSVLIPRAEYLINSGRWQEPEMADLMNRLARVATRMQTYWLLKAYWHAFRGEPDQIRAAIAHGEAMKPVTVDMSKFSALKAALEKPNE
jgi:hypothetical protein